MQYIIVDGTSYIFRAFFAMPPLTAPNGAPTGVIYGVVNMLRKLLKEYPTDMITVVFDPAGPTTRHEIFPQYKANRTSAPDDLIAQIQPTIDLIKAFGWPILTIPKIEADDVIGSLATQAASAGFDVLISTADKDFAQLVSPKIKLINTMSNTILDEAGVVNKFKVKPEQIIDYLALIGDSSDNIPGIAKVGPKTAVKWLEQWGSLEKIIDNCDSFSGKVAENLKKDLDNLKIYQQLVTINTNIGICFKEHSTPNKRDTDKLQLLLKDFGFKIWLQQLNTSAPATLKFEKIITLADIESLNNWIYQATTQNKIYLYLEESILYLSYDNVSCVILDTAALSSNNSMVQKILSLISQKSIISYEIKSLLHYLADYKIKIIGKIYDLKIAAYHLSENNQQNDLLSLAQNHLNLAITTDILKEQANLLIYQLHDIFKKQMSKSQELILEQIEFPLLIELFNMEHHGVLIDKNLLLQQSDDLAKKISLLEKEAFSIVGFEFNLNSPKQLREILFTKLQITPIKKTANGELSTAEDVLTRLAKTHKIAAIILDHRHLTKLQNTYCAKIPIMTDKNHRIHCNYNQALTSTGRLSSQNPNLQNIPRKSDISKQIRAAFIAPQDYCILSADYSQIELRVMAHFSMDKALCYAFDNNQDVHTEIAKQLFLTDNISAKQRDQAKTVNFGLIYGMSAFGLSEQLDMPRNIAQELIDSYFKQFPGVKKYLTDTKELALAQNYVTTYLGKKVHLSTSNNKQANLRAAINAPIQGTAAEIIKIAMVNLANELNTKNIRAKIIMQVHDELVLEVHNEDATAAKNIIKSTMESAIKLNVPLKVNIGIGENWATAH
jgi:DNA polymerase-1